MGQFFPRTDSKTPEVYQPVIPAEAIPKPKEKVVKFLLFGTGESGKTTMLRQMQILHTNRLPEVADIRNLICWNLVDGAGLTVKAGSKMFGKDFKSNPNAVVVLKAYENRTQAGKILENKEFVEAVRNLMDDADFQEVLAHRSAYQINDCWDYFVQKLLVDPKWPKWGGKSWTPNEDDLLHSRIRTCGQQILHFNIDGQKYELLDLGGQRQERNKFYKHIYPSDAIIYVVSMSEYDQVLFEDNSTNRLTESVHVWEKFVNQDEFKKQQIILVLNKLDLFKKKYKEMKIPIVPEFEVPSPPPLAEEDDEECTNAKQWYEELFRSRVRGEKKFQIRPYIISALDRSAVQEVMEQITSFIKQELVNI